MKNIGIAFVFLFLSLTGNAQSVSYANSYLYNGKWNIQKGDELTLGTPSDQDIYKYIFDAPLDKKNRKHLEVSAANQKVTVKDILRYQWNDDQDAIYLQVKFNNALYYIDFLYAAAANEIMRPNGVPILTVNTKLPMKDSVVFFEKVIEAKGKTKEQLYTILRKWFVDAFNDSKSVIQVEDKASGSITGQGSYPTVTDPYNSTKMTGHVDFTLNISIKDDKFKYQVYGFTILPNKRNDLPPLKIRDNPTIKASTKSQTMNEVVQGLQNDSYIRYCKFQIQKLNGVIERLDASMKTTTNTENSEW